MFYILFIFVCILLHISPIITIETTTIVNKQSLSITTTEGPQPPPPPLPNSTAKLVRFRRQPPLTIVKHIIRTSKRSKPQRRIKRPKIRYGPPSYSYGEPITYYKQRLPSSPSEHPSYSHNDFTHLNLNSADFDLPSSSYETHSMDLDFYSNAGHSHYKTSKTPKIEYSYEAQAPEEPTYSYSIPSSKPEPSYSYPSPSKPEISAPLHIPHQTYGVPKEYDYSEGHEGNSNHYDSSVTLSGGEPYHVPSEDTYEPISSSYPTQSHDPPSYAPPETIFKPSTQYGAPSSHIPDSYEPPASGPPEYHPPASNSPESYSVYDHKITNSGYSSGRQHNFAEPPSQNRDIEITYSPSYEINLSPSNHRHPGGDSFEASRDPHPGNFAEPPPQTHAPPSPPSPPQPPPSYQAPDHSGPPTQTFHPQQKHPSPQEDYLPPPSQELPLNPNHMQPTYNFPKSSYEVPIYDPIPFEASNKNEEEFYPPHPQDHAEGQRQQNSEAESTRDENRNSESGYHSNQSQPDANQSGEEPKGDAHSQGTSTSSTTRRQRRRRKRIRGSSTTISASSSTKHILDAPELQEAFEAENNNRDHRDSSTSADTDVNESNHVSVEKQNYHINYVTSSTEVPIFSSNEKYISNSWNPMRIRTSSHHIISTPTTSHAADEGRSTSAATNRPRLRTQIRSQNRPPPTFSRSPQLTTENSAEATKSPSLSGKIEIVSIEKSRSSSYYDGTVAPPQNHSSSNLRTSRPNRFNRFHTRPSPPALTPAAANKDTTTPKRTTKSVFDTTYFKTPRTHKDLEFKLSTLGQNLPKNHKLY